MGIREDATAAPGPLADYIDGVWALKRTPAEDPRYSRYDWYVLWHLVAMMTQTPPNTPTSRNAAHSGPAFLPWHRMYLGRLEAEIADVLGKPDFALPYWNWLADGKLGEAAQRTAPVWGDGAMGGTGSPVATGRFRFDTANPADPDNWAVRIELGAGGGLFLTRRGLERNLGRGGARRLSSGSAARAAILRTQYDTEPWDRTSPQSFRNELEGWRGVAAPGMHNRVHVWVDGDMVRGHSPNDPVFFLHHCNIDRIWAFWQTRNGAGTYAPGAGASANLTSHRRNDQLFQLAGDATPPVTVADMLAAPDLAYDSFDDLQELVD